MKHMVLFFNLPVFKVQTSIHIVWAICGFYFYVCKIKPSYYGLVVLYLTYFYRNDCGNITLKCDEFFDTGVEVDNKISPNFNLENTEEDDLYDIIQEILDKGLLPKESSAAYRTHIYFHFFIISDAAWIISAFLLFAGTCFQIRKYLSLVFYFPWLIMSACIILLDVVSSVHFGLDILKIHNFTSWLKFIGVQNYDDFSEFNKHNLSYIIPVIPALFLCGLFSRVLILWIYNIVLFVQVSNTAVLAFQDNLDGNNPRCQPKTGRTRTAGQDLNLDTSASRIRNWQLFYGAVDSTSSSSKSSERDFNSNNTMRRTSTKVKIADVKSVPSSSHSPDNSDSYEKYISSIRNESLKMRPDASTYHQYTDVAESFDNKIEPTVALRRQQPWSYLKQPEERLDYGYNLNSPEYNINVDGGPANCSAKEICDSQYNLSNYEYDLNRNGRPVSHPASATPRYDSEYTLNNHEYNLHRHGIPDPLTIQVDDSEYSISNSEFKYNRRGMAPARKTFSTNL